MLDAILLGAADAAPSPAGSRVWITWCDQVAVHPTRSAPARRRVERRRRRWRCRRSRGRALHPSRPRRGGPHRPRAAAARRRRRCRAAARATWAVRLSPTALRRTGSPDYARRRRARRAHRRAQFPAVHPVGSPRAAAVATFPCADPIEAVGINTPDELRDSRAIPALAREPLTR